MLPLGMKKYLLLAACFFTLTSTLYSQTLEWRVVSSLGTGSDAGKLLVDFQVRSTVGSFRLGPTNLVVALPPNCLNGSQSALASMAGSVISGANAASYFNSTVQVTGTSDRVGLSVQPITNVTPGWPANVTTAFTRLAQVAIPISNCGCSDFNFAEAFISLGVRFSNSALYDGPDFTPTPGGTSFVAGSLVRVRAPGFTDANPSNTNRFICTAVLPADANRQVSFTSEIVAGATYYWRLKTSIGSRLSSNNLAVDFGAALTANTVILGTPSVVSVDTLFLSSVVPSGGAVPCASFKTITVYPSPSVSSPLILQGSTNICTTQPNLSFTINNVEPANVVYNLLRFDGASNTVSATTGMAVTGTTATVTVANPGAGNYTYAYSATPTLAATACSSAVAKTSGVPVTVQACAITVNPPTFLPLGPYCVGANVTITPSTSPAPALGIRFIYTWSANDPSITFPNGNVRQRIGPVPEPPVQIAVGYKISTGPVLLTCLVQELDPSNNVLRTGTNITPISITVNQSGRTDVAGAASINGPTNLAYAGNPATPAIGVFRINIGTGSAASWGVSGGSATIDLPNSATDSARINFTPASTPTTYTVTYTNPSSCAPATYTFQVTVSSCTANPGTAGPNQVTCTGGSAVVYVTNATGALKWQDSDGPAGPWFDNNTAIGNSGSQVLFVTGLPNTKYYRLKASGTTLGSGVPCDQYSATIQLSTETAPVSGTLTFPSFQTNGLCNAGSAQIIISGPNGNVEWQQSPNNVGWVTASGIPYPDSLRTGLVTSTTYYRARVYNGCSETFSNVVTISVGKPPSTSPAPLTFINPVSGVICEGNTIDIESDLDPANNETGLWTTSSTLPGSVFNEITIPAPPPGKKRYRYTSVFGEFAQTPIRLTWAVASPGCTPRVQQITLNVSRAPSGSISGFVPSSLCRGSTTNQLTVSFAAGPTLVGWDDDPLTPGLQGAFTSITPDNRTVQYVVSPSESRPSITLYAVLNSAGCGNVPLTGPTFAVNLGNLTGAWNQSINTLNVCAGQPVTLNTFGIGSNNSAYWFWTASDGTIPGVAPVSPVFNNPAGPFLSPSYVFTPAPGFTGTIPMFFVYFSPACSTNSASVQKFINVFPQPVGTINTPTGRAVCTNIFDAGPPTPARIRLSANLTPTNAIGIWSLAQANIPDGPPTSGGGTWFSTNPVYNTLPLTPQNDPNAEFEPNVVDSNKTFLLRWTTTIPNTGTTCNTDIKNITVTFSGRPNGTFGANGLPSVSAAQIDTLLPASVQAPICAGTPSTQLRGGFSGIERGKMRGIWRTKDTLSLKGGFGAFSISGTRGENAVYVSQQQDRGKSIALIWEVISPGCGSRTYLRKLPVQNVSVDASFSPTGQPGGVNVALSPICVNSTTVPLTGRTGGGATSFNWSVANSISGIFIPNANDSNAVFRPGPTDTLVTITWNVLSGTCQPVVIPRPLRVSQIPAGSRQQIPIICSPSRSDTLRGQRNASMQGQGVGSWERGLNAGPSGVFSVLVRQGNNDKSSYDPDQGNDEGRVVYLRYRITNAPCTDYLDSIGVFVAGNSINTLTQTPNTTVCAGDPVTLAVSGTASRFSWSVSTSVLSVTYPNGVNGNTAIVTPRNNETVSVLAIHDDLNGFTTSCSYPKVRNIVVTPGAALTASARRVGSTPYLQSITICRNQPVQLTMRPDSPTETITTGTSLWTRDNGNPLSEIANFITGTATDTNIVVSFPTAGTFTLLARTRTAPNGCFAFDPIIVTIVTGDNPVFPSTAVFCQDPNARGFITAANLPSIITQFPNSAPFGRFWFTPGGTPVPTFGSSSLVPAIDDTVFAVGDTLFLSLNAVRDTITYRYQVSNLQCTIDAPVTWVIQQPPATAFDAYRAGADSATTSKSFPYPVDAEGFPIIERGVTTLSLPLFAGLVDFYAPPVTNVTYQWDFGDPKPDTSATARSQGTNGNSNNASGTSVRHLYGQQGSFTVVLYALNNANSCGDFGTATNFIEIRPPEFFFPTAFTPNGDGNNDLFQALPLEANPLVISLQVFDRNGQVVYQTGGYTSPVAGQRRSYGWDGTNGTNAKLDPGMYTYRATIELVPGTNKDFVGTVTLIR